MARRRRDTVSAPITPVAEQDAYLEALAADLEIDPTRLEDELVGHADALYRVGIELARRTVARDARRRDLRAVRARVDAMIRRSARESGTDVTDTAVAVQVSDHADVVRVTKLLDGAREARRTVAVLYDAFHARGRVLEALVALRTRGRR